jgi:hypothetical protein
MERSQVVDDGKTEGCSLQGARIPEPGTDLDDL